MNPYRSSAAVPNETALSTHSSGTYKPNRIRYAINTLLLIPITFCAISLFTTWTHAKGGDNLKSAPVLTASQRFDRSILPGAILIGCVAGMTGLLWLLPDKEQPEN